MAPERRGLPRDQILVMAPSGRDASLAAATLVEAGMQARVCSDQEEMCQGLDGIGALLFTEEALTPSVMRRLEEEVVAQPAWSDLPIVVFTTRRASDLAARRALERLTQLGNVTTLERPIHPATLTSAMRAAVRARRRQYDTRRVMQELERGVAQRDQFLAMLGHELRNPLSAISNAVQLERSADLGHDSRRHLDVMERQVRHLSRLVDDLLDVSRITSGKVRLSRRTVRLDRIVRFVVEQLQPAFAARRISLLVTAPDEPIGVDGDPDRLEQVVTNLLTNALKYSAENGSVRVELLSSGADTVVRVADNGIGIATEALPYIFDLFSQATPGIERSRGGLGIGLTLVRSLVELQGGRVVAESAGPGKGATFSVILPRVRELQASGARTAQAGALAVGRRILIVEDGDDSRETLCELLEGRGHEVTAASDGLQAVERARVYRPEVALVDIGLPGIDGYEVARRVRRDLGATVVLIALTGYGQPDDRKRAAEAGFDAHLTKPIVLDRLDALLAQVKSVPRASRDAVATRDSVP